MKIKPGLAARSAATLLMTRVIDDHRGLDGLLGTKHGPKAFHNLENADKALVRAIVTTACRHRGEIEFALRNFLDRPLPKNARHLQHTLHVAAAQILFMDVPDTAAVDLAITQLKEDSRSKRFSGLGNAILRRLSKEKDSLFSDQTDENIAVMNMPSWLRKRTKKSYGRERLPLIASRHMLEPVLDINVKSDPQFWAEKLGGKHLFGNAVRIRATGKIEDWPGYHEGEWWVQDAAAQLPVHLFGNLRDKTVVDLCAAPGGKTAQLINAGAQVTAVEASKPRLLRLEKNLSRLNFSATCVHSDLFEWTPSELFDGVLLDAPCSSTGTIRRHPDVQWTKTSDMIEELADLQFKMINHAARFLRPGGTLVFANCSIDRAEGEDVFAKIKRECDTLIADPITASQVFELEELITGQHTLRSLPCHLNNVITTDKENTLSARFNGLDGFFAARFKKI